MDLLAGVRKEGSRGGRADFTWSDVETSSHRENYLGHSLKAPVGRWQKNRDLSWYAKADSQTQLSAEEARKEEIRLIKEAEQDALSRALGFAVEPRGPTGGKKVVEEVKRVVGETTHDRDEGGKGIGFGMTWRGFGGEDGVREILSGTAGKGGERGGLAGGREKGRDRETRKYHRERKDRSRSPDRHHSHRHRRDNRSRCRSRDRHTHSRSHHQRRRRDSKDGRRLRSRDRRDNHRNGEGEVTRRRTRSPSLDRAPGQNSRTRGYEDDIWRPQRRRSRSRSRSWSRERSRVEEGGRDDRDQARVDRGQGEGAGWDRRRDDWR